MLVSRRALVAVALAPFAAAGPSSLSAQSFEGVITFSTLTESGKTATMVQSTSGKKLRLDVSEAGSPSPGASVIYDLDTDKHTTLLPARKLYVVSTPNDRTVSSDSAGNSTDIQKTSRTEMVAGVSCDVYHWTRKTSSAPEEGDVCLAKGIGFEALNVLVNEYGGRSASAVGGPEITKLKQLLKGDLQVLKITTVKNGKTTVNLVATKIERVPVSSDLFRPPPDYTEFTSQKLQQPGQKPPER